MGAVQDAVWLLLGDLLGVQKQLCFEDLWRKKKTPCDLGRHLTERYRRRTICVAHLH